MEQMATAQPWQIAFFFVCCLVVTVVICVWLFTGNKESERVDLDPVGSVKTLWGSALHWRSVPITSSDRGRDRDNVDDEGGEIRRELPVKRNGETQGNGVAISEMVGSDPFQFPGLFTGLARLVLDKKVGETDAIKIAVKVAPGKGDKYAEARKRLHAAMEQEQPPKFRRSPEQEAARDALGLNKAS